MEWISVKDRLPNEKTFVLCYQDCGNASYLVLALVGNKFVEVNCDAEFKDPNIDGWYNSITHWMSLPSAPINL